MRRVVCALFALGLATLAYTTAMAHVVPSPCDFTTGGGFVFGDPWPNGPRVNFGIVGGCKNEGFYGHVNINDHGSGLHINGRVTAYFTPHPGSPFRDLCGVAKTNDPAFPEVRFRVRTRDNGEPGGDDLFGVKATRGSDATTVYLLTTRELGPPGTTGGGGNIQLHKGNPSNTGPATPPSETAECGGTDGGLGFGPAGGGGGTTPGGTGGRFEESNAGITYAGSWAQGNTDRAWSGGTAAVAVSGATATLTFSGSAVNWIGFRGPQAGIARVYLDGSQVAVVDLYSAEEQVQAVVYSASSLSSGSHTLMIEVTGLKNPAASFSYVVVDAFDVTP
jgi:hypothetical protein